MKTIIFKPFQFATITLLLFALPLTASAYDFMADGIAYQINDDGKSVAVTWENGNLDYPAYISLNGDLVIPASVTYGGKTYPVTSIGEWAFTECSGLTSVTIPNSVTSIGVYAFSFCNGLTSVNIPNSVTSIGESAFERCSGLTSVHITDLAAWCNIAFGDNPLSSAHHLFLNGKEVKDLVIPNSITFISNSAFTGCSGLTSVTIPNSVTSIGEGAFNQCTSLPSIDLPNSITSIGNYAFSDCSGLTSVTIPNSITSIGEGVFSGCSGLTNINWNVRSYPDFSWGNSPFNELTGIKTFNFGNDVESIPSGLCLYLSGLTSVTIPNSVNSIGEFAFWGCSGLTSIILGSSVTSIRDNAFGECSGLTSIIIPNSVTSIGGNAFFNCYNLSSIYSLISHPSNVVLGESVFNGVSGTLYVNVGSVEEYRNADQWNYLNITDEWTRANSISMSDTALQLYADKSDTLQVSYNPADACIQMCYWSSSDPAVAEVDQNGTVTAITVGSAIITATTIDGSELNATCEVTVTGTTSLTLNKEEMDLFLGDSETLVPSFEPVEMTGSNLLWQSSDPAVAEVDQNGAVTALEVGDAIITATTTDGTNISASCQVIVSYEYALIADTIKHTRGEDTATIEYPVELINTNTITGLQFEVELPDGVSLIFDDDVADVWLDDARKAGDHSISVNVLEDNHYFFIITSPTNKELKGYDGTLFYMNLLVDQYHNSGIYNINFTNLTLAETSETEHAAVNTTSIVQLSYMLGDADADAKVDVADYITTALRIMNKPTIRFYEDAANVHTANPAINVTDLTGITNIALGIRPAEILHAPALDGTAPASYNEPALDVNVRALEADKLLLTVNLVNDQPMAAMQLDMQLPEGVSVEDAELTGRAGNLQLSTGALDDGSMRLLASVFSDAEIEPGNDAVLNIILKGNSNACGMITFRDIIMAESNLNSYELETMTLPLNATAIDGIIAGNEVRIYGENGCLVIDSPITGTAQLILMNGIAKPLKVTKGRNEYRVDDNHIYMVNFNGTTAKLKF